MNIVDQVIILSGELSSKTFEGNRQRTETLKGVLQDTHINFAQARGVYKGGSETSFVTVPRDTNEIEFLKHLAFEKFGQESILFQDSNQEAYLIFKDNTTQRLGRLVEVTKELAESQENYTELNGKFFITVPR